MRNIRASSRSTPWDSANHLQSAQDALDYLNAALAERDPALIAAVVGDIARAKGMTDIARKTQFGRESLYKALSQDGNPRFGTLLAVLDALGIELRAVAKPKAPAASVASRRAKSG